MDTHLFQALTLGLLLIIVVVLLVVVSMLGKVRAALESRAPAGSSPSPVEDVSDMAVEARDVESATPRDAFAVYEAEEGRDAHEPVAQAVEEAPADAGITAAHETHVAPADESHVASVTEAASDVDPVDAGEQDSDRPYERGGRWYFRRGGELLVYEEGTGEWVPAGSTQTEAAPQPAVAEAAPEAQVDETERTAAPVEARPEVTERAPSTSFGGQPVASVEDASIGSDTTEFEVSNAREEAAMAHQAESFWKCPSCGAVNGSTATTCRMCFTARP